MRGPASVGGERQGTVPGREPRQSADGRWTDTRIESVELLPTASYAVTEIVCAPGATLCGSQDSEYSGGENAAIVVSSMAERISVTATSSAAEASICTAST